MHVRVVWVDFDRFALILMDFLCGFVCFSEIMMDVDGISLILIHFELFLYDFDKFCWILVILGTERVKLAKRVKRVKRVKRIKLGLDFKHIYIYIYICMILVFRV